MDSLKIERKISLILEAKKQESSVTPFKKDYIYHKYVHSHNNIDELFSKFNIDAEGLKEIKRKRSVSPRLAKNPQLENNLLRKVWKRLRQKESSAHRIK